MEHLPQEILVIVISLLDLKTKLVLRLACTRLFDIIDHKDFVLYFTRSKQLPEIASVLSRYNKPISIRFTKTIELKAKALGYLSKITSLTSITTSKKYTTAKDYQKLRGLSRLANLVFLDLGQDSINYEDSPIQQHLNNITRLELNSSLPAEYYQQTDEQKIQTLKMVLDAHGKILQNKTNLLSLKIDDSMIDILTEIPRINHLTSLQLGFVNAIYPNAAISALNKAYNLKRLHLHTNDSKFNMTTVLKTSLSLTTFTDLEELATNQISFFGNIEECSKLTKLDLTKKDLDYLSLQGGGDMTNLAWTALTNLENLSIAGDSEPLNDFNFLTAMTRLRDLSISYYKNRQNNGWMKFAPESLTSLYCYLSTPNHRDMVTGLDGLSRLVNLQKITVFSNFFGMPVFMDVNVFLPNLVNLTQLEMYGLLVDFKYTAIQKLTNMKSLTLQGQTSIPDLIKWKRFPNLEELNLTHMPISSFSTLTVLTRLTRLVPGIYRGKLDPTILEKLPLKDLQLTNASTSEELWQSVARLTGLDSLQINVNSNTEKLSVEQCEARVLLLTALDRLTSLHISEKLNIDWKIMTRLTSLQRLVVPKGQLEKASKILTKKMTYLYNISEGY